MLVCQLPTPTDHRVHQRREFLLLQLVIVLIILDDRNV